MSFQSVMQKIGQYAKVAFTDIEAFLPLGESIAAVAYPPSAPIIGAVNVVNNLIVKAVGAVEQKWQAIGETSKNGVQKSADVISIVGPTVIAILQKEGVTVDNTYVQSVIDAVVAAMNVPILTSGTTTPAPATR